MKRNLTVTVDSELLLRTQRYARLRLDDALDDEGFADAHQALAATERALGPIRSTPLVLRRTGQLTRTTVKTPDAIHLAGALLLADVVETDLLFATHDRSRAIRVRALGFGVVGAAIWF